MLSQELRSGLGTLGWKYAGYAKRRATMAQYATCGVCKESSSSRIPVATSDMAPAAQLRLNESKYAEGDELNTLQQSSTYMMFTLPSLKLTQSLSGRVYVNLLEGSSSCRFSLFGYNRETIVAWSHFYAIPVPRHHGHAQTSYRRSPVKRPGLNS